MPLLKLSVSVEVDEKPAQTMIVIGKSVWVVVVGVWRLVREWLE
jgi:hypothetical protein